MFFEHFHLNFIYLGVRFIHDNMVLESILNRVSRAMSSPLTNRIIMFVAMIWFGASILSQALYMGFNGRPYDSMLMIEVLGPFYLLIVLIELAIWGLIGLLVINQLLNDKIVEDKIPTTS